MGCCLDDKYEPVPFETALTNCRAALELVKNQNTVLRIELRDALMIGYGAEMNWPKSAIAALGDSFS